MAKPFHLAWFMSFSAGDWEGAFSSGGQPWDGRYYIDLARQMELACLDFIMIEDTLHVSDVYGGSAAATLGNGMYAPKHDPAPLAALMGAATSKIGVVATMSTLGYPPFLLARLASTIDHMAGGRFGWNIVTSSEDRAAQNFGLDALPPHEQRYEMAEEYVDLVCKLFDSWEPGAVVMDRDRRVYADAAKVHTVDFEGKFYKCRGPLNTVRSPQGRPVFLQAGASPRGIRFAAKHADAIIGIARGVAGMKRYRDTVRQAAEEEGRDPDHVKVMFLIHPTIGETDEEALARRARFLADPASVQRSLASMSTFTNIDFAQFDLDQPLPDVTTNGTQGSLDRFAQKGSGKTLRQLALAEYDEAADPALDFVGSPDTVADKMAAVMEEVGGDGFLISPPMQRTSRRVFAEISDGLVPALQRRGLARISYTRQTLRETLREF